MSMFRLLLAATFVLCGSAAMAATCDFNAPAKAKGMKLSMVRAFSGCPSDTFPTPNSQTGGGVPTCADPSTPSEYRFDELKGSCSLKLAAKIEEPSGLCVFGCSHLTGALKCSGILESDGSTPASLIGWTLGLHLRITSEDDDNGDMTWIDFPLAVVIPDSSGRLSVSFSSVQLLDALGLDPWSPCTQVELMDVTLNDDLGNVFAVPGLGTR